MKKTTANWFNGEATMEFFNLLILIPPLRFQLPRRATLMPAAEIFALRPKHGYPSTMLRRRRRPPRTDTNASY